MAFSTKQTLQFSASLVSVQYLLFVAFILLPPFQSIQTELKERQREITVGAYHERSDYKWPLAYDDV